MAGVISVGGLASGLDTNKIVDQLVALERRPITLLEQQIAAVQKTQSSFTTLDAKLAALRTASDRLNTVPEVLAGVASSSDEHVVTAAAGTGASRGTLTLTVNQLAQGSVAGATTGVATLTDTVATGPGTFSFQVGAGAVRSIDVTTATTLDGLAHAINDLGAGVTASAINLGTADNPDYRLSIVSRDTGASSAITVVQDDTTLAVQTTQAGQNALFSVGGFSGTFERETNTIGDVLTGVTLSLKTTGSAAITVNDDADTIVKNVQALVDAFNDAVQFVAGESTIEPGKTRDELKVGSLAGNSTSRRLVDQLHDAFSQALAGATGQYVNLASLGLATQNDGTITLDEQRLRTALGDDATAAAQVLAGNGTGSGAANRISKLVAAFAGIGGALASQTSGLDGEVKILQDEIDAGERRVAAFEANLRQQFNALESLVSGLQSQASFLASALSQR